MDTRPETPPAAQKRATLKLDTRMRLRLQWAVVALICFLLALAFRPWILTMVQTRDYTLCQTNLRSISRGLRMYAQEWDDTLPPAPTWMDNAGGYMAPTSNTGFRLERYFKCPRDHSGSPSSYAYNDLFTSLRQSVRTTDPAALDRLAQIGHVDRAPMLVERHGSPHSAHLSLVDWNAVRGSMTLPHELPEPTGSIIRGNGNVSRVTGEDLATLAGRRF